MRWMVLALAWGLPAGMEAAPAACGGHGDRSTMLVSTGWLADHRADRNLVLLALGARAEYDEAHIPGSFFLDYNAIRTTPNEKNPLVLELPPMSVLAEVFARLGATNDSRIILYMLKDWSTPAARAWLTLDAMGLGARAGILDGGLPAWQSEKRPVAKEVPVPAPGKVEPCPQSDVIADLEYVKSNLHHSGVSIVDARLPDFYTGAQVGANKRAGHIPGASNIPFNSLVDGAGKLKPTDALREQFRAAGVKAGDRVVPYCHIGQQASLVYFVARYLGFDARMYDGSWDEWSSHAELPAEAPARK